MAKIYLKKHYFSLVLLLSFTSYGQSKLDVKKEFEFAAKQYEGMLASHQDLTKFPQSTQPDGFPRIVYTDNYYLEGLLRYEALKNMKKLF